MKKFLLVFLFLLFSLFVFSQADSAKTIVYKNDSAYTALSNAPEQVSIGAVNYYVRISFQQDRFGRKKAKPYYWNGELKCSNATVLSKNIVMEKLFILSDSNIYRYVYLPSRFCWSKTLLLYEKPKSVVIQFKDTTSGQTYFVKLDAAKQLAQQEKKPRKKPWWKFWL